MGSQLITAKSTGNGIDSSASFGDCYAEFAPTILAYIRRRIGDAAAEDATTEVFIRAFGQREAYEARHETPLPWLFGISANVIADHRRDERRRLRMLARLAAAKEKTSAAPAVDELSPELVRAITGLPSRDRECLLLVAWGELSYDEVAIALEIPVGTVRSRLSRARRLLDQSVPPRSPLARVNRKKGKNDG